jgi:Nucleotide modification associated domain 1
MDKSLTVTRTAEQYQSVISDCKSVFLKKTTDYGTAWSILRLPSLTDQIYIKAERIRTLEEKQVNKVGEGIEGEFLGIINYCVMALLQIEVRDSLNSEFPDRWNEVAELNEKYDEKIHVAYTTMEAKNHDYGEAWRNMRVSSFTDLILMKLLRLKQIENNEGKTLISEGDDANYIDILNYAVFALIKLTKENA